MPNIAYGDLGSKLAANAIALRKLNHSYEYPRGLDLRPGYKLHDDLVDKVLKRANDSATIMRNRFKSWSAIDQTLTSYIDLTDSEKTLKAKDDKKPVSIVFPHSYAILETMLGYLISAFFQDPVFRFEGTKPEDALGTIMLEKIIELSVNRMKMLLNMHTWFRDSLSYGFGIVAPSWTEKRGFKTVAKQRYSIFSGSKQYKAFEETVLFEGSKLSNIDPYLCLPDPNRPIMEIQDGEYFGWLDFSNYMDMLSEERSTGKFFNVKYLNALTNKRTSIYNSDESGRNIKFNDRYASNTVYTSPTDNIHMYIKVIPKDWKIGNEDYPKTFLFTVSADRIITRMQPLGLTHGMIPVSVISPDYDGYTINPVSRLEILYGMQHTLDWMFNTHIANVRKAINDTIIYDPSLLNSADLKDPKPGGLVRLRKPAWGRGVKDTFAQLAITDVTRGHVADTALIRDIMDKIGGVDSSSMGSLRQGGPERLTKAEFTGTRAGTFTRLERIARIIGIQGMQDLGYMIAHHTQQFMSQETYVKAAGRWQDVLVAEYGIVDPNDRMKVSPFDILVDYDLKVRDGTIPGGNYSAVWMNMFEVLVKQPELLQTFDITRIFKHIARNNGAKNVDRFVRITQKPLDQVSRGVEQGNLIPVNQIGEVNAAA